MVTFDQHLEVFNLSMLQSMPIRTFLKEEYKNVYKMNLNSCNIIDEVVFWWYAVVDFVLYNWSWLNTVFV